EDIAGSIHKYVTCVAERSQHGYNLNYEEYRYVTCGAECCQHSYNLNYEEYSDEYKKARKCGPLS
ncbi:hypothetical protein, partial [Providencia hangzhouensis]